MAENRSKILLYLHPNALPRQMYNLPYGGTARFLTRCPACSSPLSSHFSRLVVFLVCSDVFTFSPDFNGLTVSSTVNFGGRESASCGLHCSSSSQFAVKPWLLSYHGLCG